MSLKISELVKDISKIDLQDICTDWNWLIGEQKKVVLMTLFGDMFLLGEHNEVNWLDTSIGKLTRVADTIDDFEEQLKNADNFSSWFMPSLYLDLQSKKILLNDNEVYSYKQIPLLGGDYTVNNIEKTDISVHFSITGQITQQTQNISPKTPIKVSLTEDKRWWKIW